MADPARNSPLVLRQADDGRSTLTRAFLILDAFREEMVLGVRAIARHTGLPAATVHRIAIQLVELDALSRVGRQYRLGPRVFEIGSLHYPPRLRTALHPFLVDLQRATGYDVSTLELAGTCVVVVDHIPARSHSSPLVKVGARIPAHATAAGKAILAQSSPLPLGFGPDADLIALTHRTVIEFAQLQRELEQIRRAGIAYEHCEAELATKAVAAPLLNRHGRVLGALMVSSTAPDFHPDNAAVAVATLARTLTRVGASTNIPFYARLPRSGGGTEC